MPVRDRGARERFMRQASFSGPATGGPLFHHPPPPARRSSVHVQDSAALRNRRRSTLRRQVARELIAEEEEGLPGDPKPPPSYAAAVDICERRRGSGIGHQELSPITAPSDMSRLRSRRQSTPVVLPLRVDPEFTSGRPLRSTPRGSIPTDEPEPSGSTAPFRQFFFFFITII